MQTININIVMDNMQLFALRLKNARQSKKMSMAALSSALGNIVSPQAIYKYEAGKMLPSSSVIIELSRIFNVPMDYFFRPIKTAVTNIEFRKKSRLGVKEINAIKMQAIDILERYVEISDISGNVLPSFMLLDNNVATKEDVVRVASELRKKWEVPHDGIDNVIAFLESIGIIVIEIEASIDFDGFSGMADQTPVIVLNKSYQPERKRFTAMHELGHLVLNIDSTISDKETEKFCHLFAGEMLIPVEEMKGKLGDIQHRKISLQEMAELQKVYGISIDALMHKAKDFEMISDTKYRNYNIMKNTKPAFKEFAEKSRYADEYTDKFSKMVYRAYADELISGSKASSLLGIPMQTMLENAMFV